MKNEERKVSQSSVILFGDIPFEGLDLNITEKFADLYRSGEEIDPELLEMFTEPVEIKGSVTPVASKVDLRGTFSSAISCICDRCTGAVSVPVKGPIDTFLMARTQFSEHDKPGGKVIHGPTRGLKPSRHRSKSKAPVLTDAEGEHEDQNFGAFDGHTIDLRPLVRELMILQIPMKTLCSEDCQGLCLTCGGSVTAAKCTCKGGPTLVKAEEPEVSELSPLAAALQKRSRKTF